MIRLQAIGAMCRHHLDEMGRAVTRAVYTPARVLAWLWNTIKAVPGVHQVGHGLATVLGLYRLDRWLIERESKADLKLADHLASVGMAEQATMLRDAVAKRRVERKPTGP